MSPEVADALASGQPIVALESTIIAHGFPRPENRMLAQDLEQAVRDQGAVPATIAIIDGDVRIGLVPTQLDRIANDPGVGKASIRDLGAAIAQGTSAATTVASTAHLAAQAGLRVFATGGIGGVHRDAGSTMDISADLRAMARTPVAIVSAGAKSVLDLACTLEVLETEGVPVVGFRCDHFPAFYSRSSGHRLVLRADDPDGVARLCLAHWRLALSQSVLVCNPIPSADEIEATLVESWIQIAQDEARAQGVHGKALTPFLLGRLLSLSGGRTLPANRSLALSNARLAGQIAVCLQGAGARDA